MAFEDEIKRIQKTIEVSVGDNVAETAFAILSTVTLATPVGNPTLWQNPSSAPPGYVGGRARGNWQVGISAEEAGETGEIDGSGANTISKGRSRLAGYRLGEGKIIVNNNVPYIGPLNDGSSTQAPVGFVEKAVQAAVNQAQQGLSGL